MSWDSPCVVDPFGYDWAKMTTGSTVSVVLDATYHTSDLMVGTLVPEGLPVRIHGAVNRQVAGCRRLTVYDALVEKVGATVDLLLTDLSEVVAHGLFPADSVFRVVELCSGIACSSKGLQVAGLEHVGSMEWRQPLVALHRLSCPGVPVVHGDIADPSCLKELAQKVAPPFAVMSGVSCQPYSTGGNQAGSSDERAGTVPATMKAVHLFQSPFLILECVTQAKSNQYVRSHIQLLANKLGYHIHELTLKLEEVWCSRRYRWWVVATHPSLCQVTVPDWPKQPTLSIRDVMPFIKQWSPEIMQALLLTDHEVSRFTLDGSVLRKYTVQMDSKLPTCLHAWGNQADPCPCGCRPSGFQDSVIQQRGIYAQLFPVPVDAGPGLYRHLHPSELAILNGMIPPDAWTSLEPKDLRLCLCAVGQLASPLQSVWVGACLVQQMQAFLDLPQIDPLEVLSKYRSSLFACAMHMFPSVAPALPDAGMVKLVYPDGTMTQVQVTTATTLIELFQAELNLNEDTLNGQWLDDVTGLPLDFQSLVAGKSIRVQGIAGSSSGGEVALTAALLAQIPLDFGSPDVPMCPPTAPATGSDASEPAPEPVTCPGEANDDRITPPAGSIAAATAAMWPVSASMDTLFGLRQLNGSQLAALLAPVVTTESTCQSFRQNMVHMPSRLDVLANQEGAMGDDELNLHVRACVLMSGRSDTQYLDPLLALGWMRHGTVDCVAAWLRRSPDLTRVVTAVHVLGHWMPVMWTLGLSEVHVSLWEHTDVDVEVLNPLHGLVCQAWSRPMFTLACTRRSFSRGHCGAAVMAFLFHHLLGKNLPASEAELLTLHTDLRASFVTACMSNAAIPKPWLWGLGQPDVISLTSELLKSHGVPPAQVLHRAKLVVQSLGRSEVQQAVMGVAPWKSLKALANLQSPCLQLVLPDEQAAVMNAKPPAKKAPPNKALPTRPADLDPLKLQVEHGVFCCGQDEPVSQISFATVGPLATGVALSSFADALPFLTSGKKLTSRGLALLVLQPPSDFRTNLEWSTIRFAARCSMNHEPLLVSGVLVQLGQIPVYQYTAKDIPAIMSVEVACARVSVYKDQWDGGWEDFSAKPVKHILGVLSCLQTCRNEAGCTCGLWHPPADQPHDALLDVFRRQFYNDAGRSVKWDKATHFAVFIRYAKCLESKILSVSGLHGLFTEPKTEDALQPHADYQVIWMPQMDFQAVLHHAKCEVACLGVARSGRRFGLRVHVQHFQRVFTSLKPDAVYLAPGSRLDFQCGPWPFGCDRKSIAKTLKAGGWKCRPLQPLNHVPGGLMWAVQAVTEPPQNVLSLQHGQVVITSTAAKTVPFDEAAQVVGHAKTVDMCRPADAHAVDPWLTNDPWSKAVAQTPVQHFAPQPPNVLHELEQRVEQSIMAKLPVAEKMEIDDQDQRLQALEQQVQQLASRQTGLEHLVQENHAQNTAQVQTLQQQMKVQLDYQSQQMQTMLSDQMTRLEAILSKKPRTE